MKVLITGGTGFIGSRLALKCLARGDQVTVLGQENNEAEADNKQIIEKRGAKVVLASVSNQEKIIEIIAGIDVVFHLAAAQHEANVPDKRFWDVNVMGTKNMLDASFQAGVKRFVHGSTIGVYGSAMDGEINWKSPLKPDNIYGITKLEAEKQVLSFQDKLPVAIIRISETYGPGDRRLLKLFKAIKKNSFFLIGDGQNLHHLIFIDDLTEGLYLAATIEEAVGQVFVLAGPKPITTKEMSDTIANELNTSIPGIRAPLSPFLLLASGMEAVLRPLGIQPPLHRRRMDFFKKSFLFSPELSSGLSGFAPKYSFKEGVAKTAHWYKEKGYL